VHSFLEAAQPFASDGMWIVRVDFTTGGKAFAFVVSTQERIIVLAVEPHDIPPKAHSPALRPGEQTAAEIMSRP
jgi:hypothetical protein